MIEALAKVCKDHHAELASTLIHIFCTYDCLVPLINACLAKSVDDEGMLATTSCPLLRALLSREVVVQSLLGAYTIEVWPNMMMPLVPKLSNICTREVPKLNNVCTREVPKQCLH